MEEVKAELTAQLENPVAFTIPVLGGIPVSQSVVVSWIIMAALTLAAILLTRNLKPVPGRRQLVLEMFVGLINNFSRDIIGKEWRRFAPWLGTAALYIKHYVCSPDYPYRRGDQGTVGRQVRVQDVPISSNSANT